MKRPREYDDGDSSLDLEEISMRNQKRALEKALRDFEENTPQEITDQIKRLRNNEY